MPLDKPFQISCNREENGGFFLNYEDVVKRYEFEGKSKARCGKINGENDEA